MLPLVQRELKVTARNPELHGRRLLLSTLLVLGACFLMVDSSLQTRRSSPVAFSVFSTLGWLYCMVDGLRRASDCLSREKREGTIGFLFLTDLRVADILAGKFISVAIPSVNGLLAFIPVCSVTLLLGGLTLGEFWRAIFVMVLSLCFSLSLGICFSALKRNDPFWTTVWIAAFFSLGPLLLAESVQIPGLKAASPLFLLWTADESYYIPHPVWYWGGIVWLMLAVLLLLAISVFVLPRRWHDKPVVFTPKNLNKKSISRRTEFLNKNPILWLTFNRRERIIFNSLFFTIVGAILALKIFEQKLFETGGLDYAGLFLLTLLLNFYVASQASLNFSNMLSNGSMELILSTPINSSQIIRGQLLSLWRMLGPASLVLLGWYILASPSFQNVGLWPGFSRLIQVKPILEFVIGLITLSYTGMWFGLTTKNPSTALLKTLGLGMLLPYLFCLPTIVAQLVILGIAIGQVKKRFRNFVEDRYLQPPHAFVLAPAIDANPNLPPVIR